MDDFNIDNDFNFDFDEKPADKKEEGKNKISDPIVDDFGDFNFEDSPEPQKVAPKPQESKNDEKPKPKAKDVDDFMDDFGDFGNGFDDFGTSPKKKEEKPKKDDFLGGDSFQDPFASPEKKPQEQLKEPPKEEKKDLDNFFTPKKDDTDFLDDFGDFDTKPKPPSKPQPGASQIPKKQEESSKDNFLDEKDPFDPMENFLNLPPKTSQPPSRASSQNRSNSAKKSLLPTPQRKSEPAPAQILPQQKPVTDFDENKPKHVTFEKPQESIAEPPPQTHFEPIAIHSKPISQPSEQIQPNIGTMQFQQMNDDLQGQLKAIAQSMEILLDGQRRQQQQISQLQNKEQKWDRPEVDTSGIDQRLSKLENQLERLSQNTLQFNTFINEFNQKQADLQRQQQDIDQQNNKLQIQRGTLVNEIESMESRKEAMESQQANIQQLIQSANQLIQQTSNIDQMLKTRLESLFTEKSIDSDVQQLITKSINQQLENQFKNYTSNVTELLGSNQLQVIQLLKSMQSASGSDSSTHQSQIIQQQLQLFTNNLMAQLGDKFALIDGQFADLEGKQSRLPEKIGGAVQNAVSQVLKSLPALTPSDGVTGAGETGHKTCAVYLELVKQLQNKVEAAESTLKSQNQNITEQQLSVKLQAEENERLRQRLEIAEKHAQIQLAKAAELEDLNQQALQKLHAKERELVLKEQSLKRRQEEADQRVMQAELMETQLEKLRIEISQRKDELKSQRLVMEVEAEKRDFRQMKDIEDRLLNPQRAVSSPNIPIQAVQQIPVQASPQNFFPMTPGQNPAITMQNTFQGAPGGFQQWSNQNPYFPPRPSHSKLSSSDMASFQQAKKQLKDIVTRGSSVSSGSAIIDEPVDPDIDQKLQALKISHGIQTRNSQHQSQYTAPVQPQITSSAVKAQEQMLQQIQQQQQLMQQQMLQMMQQQQNQANQKQIEAVDPKTAPNLQLQPDSTPSDGAALQAVRPFTPMNKLGQSQVTGPVTLNGVTPLQPDASLDVSSGGAVAGSESRDTSGFGASKSVQKPQTIQQTVPAGESLLSSQATNRTVQQIGNAKPPKQPLQASESVAEPKQVPIIPTQTNLRNPFADSQSDNPGPVTLQSTSDAVIGVAKAFQGKESPKSNSASGAGNLPGGQNIKILTDEESGLSGYEFKFQYNKPLQLQSQSGAPESGPGVSQSAPGMQVSSSGQMGATTTTKGQPVDQSVKDSPGKSQSRSVNNPFESGAQSQSGMRNHFNEFKYDNDNFNIFKSGSQSSTSNFFPF